MKKLLPIAGILMLVVSLSSCHKETNCKCTTTYTDSTNTPDVYYTDGVKGKEGKCWQYEGTDYNWQTGAEEAVTECEKV